MGIADTPGLRPYHRQVPATTGPRTENAGGASAAPDSVVRLLVLATHPIQYQVPLFRHMALSPTIDLTVAFLTDFGTRPSADPGYDRLVEYDIDLTSGYRHRFLHVGHTTPPPRTLLPPPSFLSTLTPTRYDAVMVSGYATAAAWAVCLTAMVRKIPYLMRGETRVETERARPRWRRTAKRAVVGPLLRHAHACLAIGQSNYQFYRAFGVPDHRIVHAPYSVDTARFASEGREGRERRKALLDAVGLDPKLPLVLFSGKLQDHKRPLDLLDATARIAHPANVVLIGDGPLRILVQQRVRQQGRCRWLGFVNQSEIGHWYGAADILVLPSSREPWGLVVNEAMAAGTVPVCSSEVGCAPDLALPGIGAIYPVGQIDALVQTLDQLLSDPNRLARMQGAAALRSNAYSIAATADGIQDALAPLRGHPR